MFRLVGADPACFLIPERTAVLDDRLSEDKESNPEALVWALNSRIPKALPCTAKKLLYGGHEIEDGSLLRTAKEVYDSDP